ncbi:hypothetical protein BGZ50_004034 [Haplosporangium sp. Z 11]|nr:hypothetical protein BGZ50_004034 [Haplosporangium sp. Z 11]
MLPTVLGSEQLPSSHLPLLDQAIAGISNIDSANAFAIHAFLPGTSTTTGTAPSLILSQPSSHLPHSQLDFLGSPEIQSLPGLMSPNPSFRDLSESGREEEDEDEDMDECEIFTAHGQHHPNHQYQFSKGTTPLQVLRFPHSMILESSFAVSPILPHPQQQLQQASHQYQLYNTKASSVETYIMYPQLQVQQQQAYHQLHNDQQYLSCETQLQHLQHQQQQQHSPFPTYLQTSNTTPGINSLSQQPTPSISSYNSQEPLVQAQSYRDLNSLDYYLSSLVHQQFQRPTLQSVSPSFDQGMDLLAAPQMQSSSNTDLLPMLMPSSPSTLVQSPTMSWATVTPTRDSSPDLTATVVERSKYRVKKPAFRCPKKRSDSTCSRSGSKVSKTKIIASSAHQTDSGSTPISDDSSSAYNNGDINSNSNTDSSHTQGPSSPSMTTPTTPVKRKRRARQVKIKVKPISFACDSPGCDKIFSRAYNLTSHMKTHSAERPFLCGSCPLAFARRHDRERHVRLHTGEKPYTCDNCGMGFMRNDALHRHQRICGQSAAALRALWQQQQSQSQSQSQEQGQADVDAEHESATMCEGFFSVHP